MLRWRSREGNLSGLRQPVAARTEGDQVLQSVGDQVVLVDPWHVAETIERDDVMASAPKSQNAPRESAELFDGESAFRRVAHAVHPTQVLNGVSTTARERQEVVEGRNFPRQCAPTQTAAVRFPQCRTQRRRRGCFATCGALTQIKRQATPLESDRVGLLAGLDTRLAPATQSRPIALHAIEGRQRFMFATGSATLGSNRKGRILALHGGSNLHHVMLRAGRNPVPGLSVAPNYTMGRA